VSASEAGAGESWEGPDDAGLPWSQGRHPLVGRQTTLISALRVAGAVAWVCAAAGAFLPGVAGQVGATALVAVIIAVPIARSAWLCVRWIRRGDPRYAVVAGVLVLIALSGVVLA